MGSAVSVITAGATPTLTIGLSNIYTDTITTDNQDQTITFSAAGTSGDRLMIIFITDTGGGADVFFFLRFGFCILADNSTN